MFRVTLYEERENNRCIFDGWVSNKKLKEIEDMATFGGFNRYSIDIWEESKKKQITNYIKLDKYFKAVFTHKGTDEFQKEWS